MRIFLPFFAVGALFLAGCGPMIGAGMVAGAGVKDVRVLSGDLSKLVPGKNLLVLGPLAKTERAFYICRGDEAASLTSEFNAAGLFRADLHMADRYADNSELFAALHKKTPTAIKAELGLTHEPDILLNGLVLHRTTVAAPTKGVLMDVGYRLDFYDLRAKKMVRVEVEVKDLFQDCIPSLVAELVPLISGH